MASLIDPKKVKKFELGEADLGEANANRLTLTEHLGEMEKKAGYEVPEELAGLDPWERQLAAHGLDISKSETLVQDFFQADPSNRFLFPEFIDRNIKLGLRLGRMQLRLEDCFAVSDTKVKSLTVSGVGVDKSKDKAKPSRVAQGAKFPKMSLKTKNKTIELGKVGRELEITYEAMMTLQILQAAVYFQRLGFYMSREMTAEALRVIRDGDGNSNAAAAFNAGGTWNYAKLVPVLLYEDEGAEISHVVMPREFLLQILTDDTNFPQFQSRSILEAFLMTGEIKDFAGKTWRVHSGLDAESVVGFERETCLKYHQLAGSAIQETDKIIRQQIQGTVISVHFAFSKMFDTAAVYKTKS